MATVNDPVGRRPETGSAVVEFVLVMALLVPMVLGIVQLGLVLHVRNTLTAAASDGARAGAPAGATPGDAARRARMLISHALADRYADRVAAHATTVQDVPAVQVDIDARVPALGLLGPAVNLHVTGHAVREILP